MEQKKRWARALIAFFLVTAYTARPAWPWETTAVDDGPVIGPSSLAVDHSDHVHIVHRDEASQWLKYASNTTGAWVSGFIEPSLAARYPSVAVDSDGHLHIVCISDEGNKYLTNSSGSWTARDVENGSYPSIAVDAFGHVHICSMGDYAQYTTNSSGDWVTEELFTDSPPGFFYSLRTSIAVDSAGHAYLRYGVYMDFPGDGSEYYATNASGSWVQTSLPLTPLESLVFYPSIAIDASDRLHISYMSFLAVLGDDIGIHLGHTTNVTGKMRSGIVALVGLNWPVSTATVTGSANAVHVIYSYQGEDYAHRVKYATNAQGAWAVSGPLTDRIDGSAPSLGVDSSGKVYISYVDTGHRLLVISGMAEDLSPTWPGTPAEAAAYGQTSRVGSRLFNNLAFLLVPIGAVIFLRVLRRRK